MLLLSGCNAAEEPDVRDLLLVTLDTTRFDAFSFAGNGRIETPLLDSLAAEGVVFDQAIAPSPLTLVSHATLFTGQIPPVHGVRNNAGYRLEDGATTLAEILSQSGFRTGAFVGAGVLSRHGGIAQGFDHYDDAVEARSAMRSGHYLERRAESVVRQAIDWLRRQGTERTFTWVHLFDPHAPHDPPEPERQVYRDTAYLGEIAYCDRALAPLLKEYERSGRGEKLLVVVTADHGESLGDHGESTHGVFVYDATLRIPLILRGPGVPRGARVESQVGLVDLLPTLLDLLDLPAPSALQGRSLVSEFRDHRSEAKPLYFESYYPELGFGWSALRGIRMDGWKLIVGARTELYDLEQDPDEQVDLSPVEEERTRALARELAALPDRGIEGLPEEEVRTDLEALGYVTPARRSSRVNSGRDPKEVISLILPMSISREVFDRGFQGEGSKRCEAVLDQDPTNPYFLRSCQDMRKVRGRLPDAGEPERHPNLHELAFSEPDGAVRVRARLEPTPPARDTDPRSWILLYRACHELRDPLCAALGVVRATRLVADPARLDQLVQTLLPGSLRGEFAEMQGRFEAPGIPVGEAGGKGTREITLYDSALDDAMAAAALGDFDKVRLRLTQVTEIFFAERPLTERPTHSVSARDVQKATLLDKIAAACWAVGNSSTALQAWHLAAMHVPGSASLRFNLGLAWKAFPDPETAALHFEACLRLDPEFPQAESYLRSMRSLISAAS